MPGKLENWYSTVNSPTYNFTLYIVHPEVANNPTILANDSGLRNTGRAYVIAQSGSETTYSIDNVVMMATLVPGDRNGNVLVGNINFDITEVLGFDLLERLLSLSSEFQFENITNAAFVLKLEFKGRDPISGGPAIYPGKFFYPLKITTINASVGPDGARYSILAALNPTVALEDARVETDISFANVRTVSDFLTKLESRLNQYEADIRKSTQNDPSQPGKRHSIRMSGDFASKLATAQFAGIINGTDGRSRAVGADSLSFTVNANTAMPTYITDTLTKEIPAYIELYNSARQSMASRARTVPAIPYIVVNTDIERGTETDPQTLQRIDTIVYTVDLFYSVTRPDDEIPQREIVDRTSPVYQAGLLRQMEQFVRKTYSYLFSSDNTEILNLDLNYDMQYFSAKAPSGGLNYTNAAQDFQPTQAEPVNPIQGFISGRTFVPRIRGLVTPVYDYTNAPANRQRVQETTGSADPESAAEAREYFGQFNKVINLEITIKGDPFWMGMPGSDTTGAITNEQTCLREDSLIALINYLPNESLTYVGNRQRPRMDPFVSGIYRVTHISSRFQMGKFTQTLSTQKHTELTAALVENRLLGLL